MKRTLSYVLAAAFCLAAAARPASAAGSVCVGCHKAQSAALVMEWERSKHARNGVDCLACHKASATDEGSWLHHGERVSAIVTPKTCAQCHGREAEEFSRSHHARAGEILASLDNVLAEKAAGMPGNNADAVNGCLQCHGGLVKFKKDEKGAVLRSGPEGRPVIDPDTWPNSGIGRINPDGSRGSCNACHSRHSFEAKTARSPENCGKCHMGPDHPQIEIYNESKHGIAFDANRDRMALDKDEWVLGRDYSAAPTCATCHIGGHTQKGGAAAGNSHDVGGRISWTLRPVVSAKQNLVVFEDGFKEDYPEPRALPKPGDSVETVEKVREGDALVSRKVTRKVASVLTWQQRRADMTAVCANCHSSDFTGNFYKQFDSLVDLYNEKFARPAKSIMDELTADGVLNAKAPFEHEVQWVYWELWHHEGRRARHGASMMGPDYTHWHGMYEVSKHFYTKFLPAVVEAAREKGPEAEKKWGAKVAELLAKDEHVWVKGLSAKEAEALRKYAKDRYGQ
ncbi:MAG: multiheme c-type cytochrome [Elusimicrobia bacterium]|nr:multiheme c-type cytochrome [Elusimicrobiota bacterium]